MITGDRRAARIVEAGYRWASTDDEWLGGIADAASPFDVGGGVMAYLVGLDRAPKMTSIVARGAATAQDVAAVCDMTGAFTPGFARAMYAPTEFAGNAAWRLERLAVSFATTPGAIESRAGSKLPSMWALIGGDPRLRAVNVAFVSPERIDAQTPYPARRFAKQLGLVAAHLGAALRLRTAVTAFRADDTATEAVLTPRGKVLHASGPAVRHRRAIADAVQRSERARLTRTSDEEALELWRALVSGRWSIIDIEERDGKRLLLARKNNIDGGADLSTLDELDRDVLWLVAMGHSMKFVGYELGISAPTVRRRLDRGMTTLGIATRRDLVRFFAKRRESK